MIEVEELPLNPSVGDTYVIKGNGISAYTHCIFKYPCKFIPHIPRWFLKKYGNELTIKHGVIDPFAGSGTTLVESDLLNYPSYGVDIDALSCLLSKVKTTKFSKNELASLREIADKLALELPKELDKKKIEKFIPTIENIEYWFSPEAMTELAKIKYYIHKYSAGNEKIKDFLMIVLASIVRRVSLADEQSPKPYISRTRKKEASIPAKTYLDYLKRYIKAIEEYSSATKISGSKIIGFDARKIDKKAIKGGKVHLAMTSPPYINAFDYVRSLKLENIWLDLVTKEDIARLYEIQIGTEKIPAEKYKSSAPKTGIKNLDKKLEEIYAVDKKRAYVVADYFDAMKANMTAIKELLVEDGYYCIVVGDSIIRGVEIPTSRYIVEIGKQLGLAKKDDFSYIIRNRYLRIPRMGRGGFIPKDYILVFRKG